jgi:hypothetical protein
MDTFDDRMAATAADAIAKEQADEAAERRERIREGNRIRKQRQRERDRAEIGGDLEADRIRAGALIPGEVRPGVNYSTLEEAIQCALRWAAVLGIADPIQPGTTLTDWERRIYYEWLRQGCKVLYDATNTLRHDFGFYAPKMPKFDDIWTERVPGCDDPLPLSGSYIGPSNSSEIGHTDAN